MKLRQPGESKDDGRYKMDRKELLRKLRKKGVTARAVGSGLYILKKDFIIHAIRLKPVVPAGIVFRLAGKFFIQADDLYKD